jgi:hypothetical protein
MRARERSAADNQIDKLDPLFEHELSEVFIRTPSHGPAVDTSRRGDPHPGTGGRV